MALIICPDCGKRFSDRAIACPDCGCPTEYVLNATIDNNSENEILDMNSDCEMATDSNDTLPSDIDAPSQTSAIEKALGNITNAAKERLQCPSYGAVSVDMNNKRFMLKGEIISAPDKAVMKIAKGSLAVVTCGLSVLGEKAVKAGKGAIDSVTWYNFDDLIAFQPKYNNERQYSSDGARVRIAKGVYVGSKSGTSKNVTTSAYILTKIMSENNLITVKTPIINKPLSGHAFEKAMKYLNDTIDGLTIILNNK